MDPLSDVLSLIKPKSYISGGWNMGGRWAIRFERNLGVKCYAVISGEVWLVVDDVAEPVRLKAGDCFLLPRRRPFRLASHLDVPPMDGHAVFSRPMSGGVFTHGGGGDLFMAGGHFTLSGHHADLLLGALPPVVHLHSEADKTALRRTLEQMGEELRQPRPGGALVAQHLVYTLLVQVLRLHLAEGSAGGVGWLFALGDRQIGAALAALHEDPARRWTLEALAAEVGMSRSSFAQRFRETVGSPPMEYLARWRMLLAEDRLAHTREPVSAIARALGYESESAFSTAFRRVMGYSPRRRAGEAKASAPPPPAEAPRPEPAAAYS